MRNRKNKLAKRILAFVLSGAMVISGLAPTGMTAYAAEASTEFSTELVEESIEKTEAIESEETPDANFGADAKEETTTKTADEEASEQETTKEAAPTSEAVTAVENTDVEKEIIETETEEQDENVKEGELQSISAGTTAIVGFNQYETNLGVPESGSITVGASDNKVVGNGYFQVMQNAKINDKTKQAKYFYEYDATNGLKKFDQEKDIGMGGGRVQLNGTKMVKFITSEAVDVTLYWTASSSLGQISIVDESENVIAETDETVGASYQYVSVLTLEEKGTYYIGGKDYLYGVKVAPKAEKDTRTEWDFTATDSDMKDVASFNKCTIYYHGLKVEANNSGNFAKNSSGVTLNTNGRIRVPVPKGKRSKITITAADEASALYTVEGTVGSEEPTGVTSAFTCDGTKEYASIVATGTSKIASIKVEEVETVAISGTVKGIEDGTTGLKIKFTDKADENSFVETDINSNGSYTANLYKGSTYVISLSADKYEVTEPETREIEVTEAKTLDITVESMDVISVTGNVIFPTGITAPEGFKLIFVSDDEKKHTPLVTIKDDGTYQVSLKKNTTYNVTAEGKKLHDFDYAPKQMIMTQESSQDIEFTEVTKRKINITVKSFNDKINVSGSEITFINVDEQDEVYDYSFTGTENIELRDGTYTVEVKDVKYPYKLDASERLEVKGDNTQYTLKFDERMEWDFFAENPDPMLYNPSLQSKPRTEYNGLYITTTSGKFNINTDAVQINEGAIIEIPVSGSGSVEITVRKPGESNYKIGTGAEQVDNTKVTNSFSYENLIKGSYLTMTATGGTTWLKSIKITRTAEPPEGGIDPADMHTIWIVGDSTSCTYNTVNAEGEIVYGDDCYYPRYGYGEVLENYIDGYYIVNNLAMSGASSKDFPSKGGGKNYDKLKTDIAEGDVLIIAFGHNDANDNTTKYTNPNGTWETEGSFAKSLYDNYIAVAQKKGAIPILCTPIVRRSSKDQYTGDRVHIKSDIDGFPGGDYRQAIIDLGQAKDVLVIDLTERTKEKWTELTASESVYLHRWNAKTEDPTTVDDTHLNIYGAKVVAHMLAKEISKLDKTKVPLAEHTANLDNVPTKEKDLVANWHYAGGHDSNYVPPTGKSAIWSDYGIFSGSVFGSVSNEINTTNYTLGKDNNNMHIKSSNGTQVSDTEDGRAMYYYKLPSDSTFTLTAKATINAMGNDATTAFGLMARDDMLIDTKFNAEVHTDGEGKTTEYVVAGTFAKDSPNCFRRKSGTLTRGEGNGETIAPVEVGKTYDLSLSFNGKGYLCKFADNTTMSQGYDYMLGTIDKSQYIGMFVSGDADITFSDIKLIVNETEIDIDNSGDDDPNKPGGDNPDDPNKPGGDNPDDPNKPGGDNPDDPNKPGGDNPDDPNKPGDDKPTNPTTPNDKIPADKKTKRISISDESKIKIETANVVYSKKQPYVIKVSYLYDSGKKDQNGNPITYQQELTENLHYTVKRAEDETTVGEKTVTIEGTNVGTDLGTFYGTKEVKYKVVGKKDLKDISKVRLTLDKNELKEIALYRNDYITPAVQGLAELGDAVNYKIVYKNNINVGKASVTIIGQNEYFGTKVLPFTVKKADLAKTDGIKITASNAEFTKGAKSWEAKTTEKKDFVYQGSPIEFGSFKIELPNGKVLRPQEDYTLAYKKNAQTGKAMLTVKGANNYSGTIKIEYTIAENEAVKTELAKYGTAEKPLDAEYSSKGARLTEIKLAESGVILKENKDYKVKYSKESKAKDIALGSTFTVTITGAGSYKNIIGKDTEVQIKVVPGSYHIKEGTIVDAKKAKGDDKVVNAAKVTDASGAKVKPADVKITWSVPATEIKVEPSDANADKDKYAATTLSCRIADKLAGVKLERTDNIKPQPFDGINSVTLTKKEIEKYTPSGLIKADEIEIVSYKNNNKFGSATVTIKGTDTGRYYGTRNLKFKIEANAKSEREPDQEESSSGGDSSGENPTKPEDPTKPVDPENPTETAPSESQTETETTTETETGTEPSPKPPVPTEGKLIDVWDFGGLEETDTAKYKNNITKADWEAMTVIQPSEDGKNQIFSETGTQAFGDLTIHYQQGDRFYSDIASNGQSLSSTAKFKYEDYTAHGQYYCGNPSTDKARFLTVNVSEGDIVYAYVGTSDGKEGEVHFDYLGESGTQADVLKTNATAPTNKKLKFVANYTGKYKLSVPNAKPIFNRVVRVPAVSVSGTIDKGALASLEGVSVKFVNDTTDAETAAVIDGTSYQASLAAGYTYTAVLAGATGYGFTDDTKKVTTTETDVAAGKSHNLVIGTMQTYAYSGEIKGFSQDADLSKLKAKLVTGTDTITLINYAESGTLGFNAQLVADVEYSIVLEGVNDYKVKGDTTVRLSAPNTEAIIEVELKEVYAVSGKFIDIDQNELTNVSIASLQFENVDDGMVYPATVENDAYNANLRDGAYSAKLDVEGYTTTTHVIVEGKAEQKALMLVSTAPLEKIERKSDVYVDCANTDGTKYKTINEALEDVRRMQAPTSDAERITIHIAPGTYREQILVDVPFVSFVNDTPNETVKLTWYYGLGYKYYSVGSEGYYDKERAYDKYQKNEGRIGEGKSEDDQSVKDWGATVRVTAADFRAQNIVFENSYNLYVTDEELEDGVEPISTKAVRTKYLDVQSSGLKERAAAMYIGDADRVEFYKCSFISSQDTLGTGKEGAGTHSYFKECFIEGNTDYICGDGDCVFDNCVLSFAGYTGNPGVTSGKGGVITAAQSGVPATAKAGSVSQHGYLFWNCTITANENREVKSGFYGRPWRPNATVTFVNTKLAHSNIIYDDGWQDMSGNKATAANFKEYNTTLLDGTAVDLSKRKPTTTGTFEKTIADYLGDWTPSHYVAEESDVSFKTNPAIEHVDKICPGTKLSVTYELNGNNNSNDASTINWYRVGEADSSTLVYSSTAATGKNYIVKKADVGFAIKVKVIPETASGKKGTAADFVTQNKVEESDDEFAGGIKIFLAGDSTVKDYSAKGMWMGGKIRDEGSWGEYLQEFFDEEKVTIVDYADGGRSSRSFINEGKLASIEKEIGKGDYLFIQFGHNDSSNSKIYLGDRYVSVGEKGTDGKYPSTPAQQTSIDTLKALDVSYFDKQATKDKCIENYGNQYYPHTSGTFKWYLTQYIEVAKKKGAIPVLVTPVSRMKYDENGKIVLDGHHDSKKTDNTESIVSSDNAYVEAVKQLAEEQNVLLIDAFAFSQNMFNDAYAADTDAKDKNSPLAKQIMNVNDGTHCNKIGGFIEAAYMANAIKNNKDMNISSAIKKPSYVGGMTTEGKFAFTVDEKGVFTAYDTSKEETTEFAYWSKVGTDFVAGMFLQGN